MSAESPSNISHNPEGGIVYYLTGIYSWNTLVRFMQIWIKLKGPIYARMRGSPCTTHLKMSLVVLKISFQWVLLCIARGKTKLCFNNLMSQLLLLENISLICEDLIGNLHTQTFKHIPILKGGLTKTSVIINLINPSNIIFYISNFNLIQAKKSIIPNCIP